MVNNNTHGNLKPDSLKKIIRQYRKTSEGTVEP
jgi:NADH:ubiquinone oxidoreductase subunit E